MRFAKIVFWIAGIWGVLVITPLYFLFDLISRTDPPPITHLGFFYGFVGAAPDLADHLFLHRDRPVALSTAHDPFECLEKLSYGAAVVLLVLQGRMHASDLAFGGTDLLLGVLFAIAYIQTTPRA